MSISRSMDKLIVIYSYNLVLLSNEKEWATDACSCMDESQKHFFLVFIY